MRRIGSLIAVDGRSDQITAQRPPQSPVARRSRLRQHVGTMLNLKARRNGIDQTFDVTLRDLLCSKPSLYGLYKGRAGVKVPFARKCLKSRIIGNLANGPHWTRAVQFFAHRWQAGEGHTE